MKILQNVHVNVMISNLEQASTGTSNCTQSKMIYTKRLFLYQTICQMIYQMIMTLIDNAELYMYKEILYCKHLVCAP